MKRVLTLTIALVAALPLFAEEKAKTTDAQQPASTTTAKPADAPAPQDSPLVAAAKRMNRRGKKPTNVITNETLTKSGGTAHVTTAATPLKPINLPPPAAEPNPTPEMAAAKKAADEKKRADAAAAAKQKAEAERQERIHTGARMAEESLEERYEAEAESYKGDQPKGGPPDPTPAPPPPPQF
jgi:hypothetical protein